MISFGLRVGGFAPRHLNRYALSVKIGTMHKTILIFLCLFLFSNATFAQEKNNYDKFLDEVAKGFRTDAEKLNKQFKLGKYDRWDADQDTGKLVFSDKGKPKVIASFQIAGSYSTYSNT